LPYIDDMPAAYAAADLALCRSGALSCAELAAVGLPAIYVPLPIGNGEQRLNAEPVVAAGGGLMVEDAAFDAGWMVEHLVPLLEDAEQREHMGRAAAGFGRLDADRELAAMVREAAGTST
jgi:UDP-N-acetylglucosamine--N-acetylmuramyl-(pentapeptide) pyrophosphoryl-undecaprenol N-acetylglucosamine transferase